jgi:hypothetical protein
MGRSIPRGVMGGLWIFEVAPPCPPEGCSPAKAGVQSGPPLSRGNKLGRVGPLPTSGSTPAEAGAQLGGALRENHAAFPTGPRPSPGWWPLGGSFCGLCGLGGHLRIRVVLRTLGQHHVPRLDLRNRDVRQRFQLLV